MRRWLLAFVMLVTTVVPFLLSGVAMAAPFARPQYDGYFLGRNDTQGDFVLQNGGVRPTFNPLSPTGKPYVESFLSRIKGQLAGGTAENKTGAAFIILTMLGAPVGTPKGQANARLAEWELDVRTYSNNNWINWNATPSYKFNTYWQGNRGGGSNPDDDAWFNDVNTTAPNDGIIFFNPDGTTYMIRKPCANPIGSASPLQQPNFNVQLTATALTSEAYNAPYYSVVAGKTYSLGVSITNFGPASSQPGTVEVMYPPGGVQLPCGPTCIPAGQVGLTPFGNGNGFRAASGPPYPPGDNWYWWSQAIPSGSGGSGSMQFTPQGAVGSTFNMEVYYAPTDLAGSIQHRTLQYKIVSQRTPGISGANGDIHAGGGLCGGLPGLPQNVTTSPSGASYGQYVVSATGSINSLLSNNAAAPVNDKLKVGNNGAYAQICRKDLLGAVNLQYPLATGISYIGGGAGSTATVALNGSEEGVYYFNGAHLKLSGTVGSPAGTKPLTIVARFGDVEITGDIKVDNSFYLPHDAPSLGIISASDILIDPGVVQVDAYLFSNGLIATCNAPVTNCATPQLRVNGFLMAKNILFGRTGVFNTNGNAISEAIVLTPQIYLNPPKYFDAGVDDTLLEGQGERPPLF